jgi:hypothetical protein
MRPCGQHTHPHIYRQADFVSSEESVQMVRRVCASFPEGFCLFQAAYRLQEVYPGATREAFTEGWNQLVSRGHLQHGPNHTWHYHLPVEDREDSQAPGCG